MKMLSLALGTCFAAAFAFASPLRSQEPPAPVEPNEEKGEVWDYATDRADRMTVSVNIAGQGPYAFVVDTGAERTLISRELATKLQLGEGTKARMHSMTEVGEVSTVIIPDLAVGTNRIKNIHAPALQRRNMGAEGMLGVDSLQSQRVSFDFTKREMTVIPSRRTERKWPEGTIVITARSRFGRLVLVDASVDGEKVHAIIDTGSEVTIGNTALRQKLERKGRLGLIAPISLMSVTGGIRLADQTRTKRMVLGGVEIHDLPIAFADVHPFRKLDLMDRPAILLGMDALQLFDRVSVDFANRRVRLLRPGRSALDGGMRNARRQPESVWSVG